jgi:zinc protease
VSAAKVLPAPVRIDLGGGALGMVEAHHALPLVSIAVVLRAGSSADPPGKEGLARIALRMLRRGCEGLTSEQIDFQIDALGAELAVDTSVSTVAVHAQVIGRSVDGLVDLMARMFATPTFPEDELGRLKRETLAEILEARDSDRALAHKALSGALFAGHPYGRSSGGTLASVESITRDDVVAFCRRALVQGNVVVGLAGDVTAERAGAIGRALVAALPPGPAMADDVPEPPPLRGRRLVVVDKPERTQTQILVGALGTAPHDPDHSALVVANAIFGGTFTSRLMREVRSKRGWSYGASSRASVDRRRQGWVMWTFPEAVNAAACLKLTLELLEAWVEKGVTPREIAFIRKYLVRSQAFEVDTAPKRLHQALDVELLGLPADYHTGWAAKVEATTAEAATAAVRARIDPSALVAVVVGTASQVLEPVRGSIAGLAESSVVPFDAE